MKSPIRAKNGPEMARSSPQRAISKRAGESKADARYWQQGNRLQLHDSAEYSARFQVAGNREWFPLGTPNKRSAAVKAAEVYSFIQSHGLAAALQKFKPKPSSENHKPATVGDLIQAATQCSNARSQSLDAYVKALRRIVSEVKAIQNGRKFDAFKGGTAEWREKVNSVRLDSITPGDIMTWKNARLKNSELNANERRSAVVTTNSLMRNAKALFGKKLLPFIRQKIELPTPLPFEEVPMEKPPSLRYISKVDAYAILARGKAELAASDPEAFKVLILALVCGLRRSEIDHLLWRNFRFPEKLLHIENTEYHQLKSEDSAGAIDLDADTCALFQGFRAQVPKELFVILSPNPPQNQKRSRSYRCNAVFQRVNAWLREQGVKGTKPLHTMRKEIGSIVASEHGIFEASRYLRHSDIRITSAFYADKKKTVTPKVFSGLLSAAGDEISISANRQSSQPTRPLEALRPFQQVG